MPKQSDDLTREGDEAQETEKGLKIPVPKREKVSGLLGKAARKRSDEGKRQPPSDQGKR